MTIKEALLAARERILEKGWTKGFGEGGAKCVMMSIEAVVPDEEWRTVGLPSINFLRTTLGIESLTKWNDLPNRTVEDVLYVLGCAINQA